MVLTVDTWSWFEGHPQKLFLTVAVTLSLPYRLRSFQYINTSIMEQYYTASNVIYVNERTMH